MNDLHLVPNVRDENITKEPIRAGFGVGLVQAAERDEKFTFGDRDIGRARAVHSDHAGKIRVCRGECARAHQRAANRGFDQLGEAMDFFARAGEQRAAAAEQKHFVA